MDWHVVFLARYASRLTSEAAPGYGRTTEITLVAFDAALHHSVAMPPPSSGLFSKTITIASLTPGRLRIVGSVRAATEALLGDFPDAAHGTVPYGDAARVCLAALAGRPSAAKARLAFLEAAIAAGIFVREGRSNRPIPATESVH